MFGSFGMLSTLIIVGVIASQFQNDWTAHAAGGWACVVMIWLYIVNFAYSWGPASWTLIAEIFPLSIRAKGTSIGASANWMCNFVIALMTPSMLAKISWGLYIFFAAWLALGMAFVWFFVPETKGKTLEQMDQVFGYVRGHLSLMFYCHLLRSISTDPSRRKRTSQCWRKFRKRLAFSEPFPTLVKMLVTRPS